MKSWGLKLVSDCVRITHLKEGANASLWKDCTKPCKDTLEVEKNMTENWTLSETQR